MTDIVANPAKTAYVQSVYNDSTSAYVHPDQISSHKQMFSTSRYTARNIPNNTLVDSDALVEFRIDPSAGNIDLMQLAWLQLSIRNNDPANNADILPSFFLLNRIEVLIAETLVETLYPLQLWTEFLLTQTEEQFQAKNTYMLYDRLTADATINNLPALTSRTVIIPLPLPHIAGKIPVSFVRQETQLRCYFSTTANVQSGGGGSTPSASLSVESAFLYVSGVKYSPVVKAVVGQALFGRQMACRFYRRNQTRNDIVCTAGSPQDIAITEFNGYSPDIKYVLRKKTLPQDLVQDWQPLTRVTNFDENGNPLGITAQDQGVIDWNLFKSYPHVAHRMRAGSFNKFIYAFPWADDVPGAILDGLSSGDIRYKSNFSVSLVPGTTGNFELVVLTYSKCVLSIDNGVVSFRIVSSGDDARGPTQN